MNKFNARKVTVGGRTFDSKKEASRAADLQLLEKAGIISNLQYQVKYELIPAQDSPQGRIRAVSYVADFTYEQNGKLVVEDVKGFKQGASYELFKLKKKMMLYLKGIFVNEI